MKNMWKVTVTNPLGQEVYDLILEEKDGLIEGIIQEPRGMISLSGKIINDSIVLSGDTEFPMKTSVELIINSDNLDVSNFEGLVSVGPYVKMSLSGARS